MLVPITTFLKSSSRFPLLNVVRFRKGKKPIYVPPAKSMFVLYGCVLHPYDLNLGYSWNVFRYYAFDSFTVIECLNQKKNN